MLYTIFSPSKISQSVSITRKYCDKNEQNNLSFHVLVCVIMNYYAVCVFGVNESKYNKYHKSKYNKYNENLYILI